MITNTVELTTKKAEKCRSEEEDLHVEVNFDEPIDLAINQFSIFKIEFQRNK